MGEICELSVNKTFAVLTVCMSVLGRWADDEHGIDRKISHIHASKTRWEKRHVCMRNVCPLLSGRRTSERRQKLNESVQERWLVATREIDDNSRRTRTYGRQKSSNGRARTAQMTANS